MDFKETKLPSNPYEKANLVSKLLFLWVFPLFAKGYKKELDIEDLYEVSKNDKTKYMGDKLEKFWHAEMERAKLKGKKPSFLQAIVKMMWKPFGVVIFAFMINHCIIVVSQPVFLRQLILNFNDPNAERWQGYMYAGLICLVAYLSTLIQQPGYFRLYTKSMNIRVAATSLIYRKSLRLGQAALKETNSGQIVNLLSNDCTRFDYNFNVVQFLFVAPFQIVIVMVLMYQQIGWSCFAGLAYIILLLPMQYYLGKYSAIFRLKIAKRTDARGRYMNEIIVGMRVIKMYAWEKPFSLMIDGIRKLEMAEIKKRSLLRGLHYAVFNFTPKLVQYLTFVAFIQVKNEPMTADKVFFVLTCLHIMIQITVNFVPQSIAGLGEVIVASNRIQEFLLLEEQSTNNNLKLFTPSNVNSGFDKDDGNKLNGNSSVNDDNSLNTSIIRKRISMQNVSANWTPDRQTLEDISFSAEGDKLIMIVGPVGSSKTSLLHTLIDELPMSSGTLSISGTVSYASQEPWIFAGNLRQNILFGLPYEDEHYKQTLKACALEQDLKQLPYSDLTIVGERGVALSGGQKARVNLARALYRKCDIYLLDDPLSAVDTKVGRHLFEMCVKNHLRGSIRILVTHQLQYLPQADHIIALNHGKILAQGTFEQLTNSGIDFEGLIHSDNNEDSGEGTSSKGQSLAETTEEQIDQGVPEENTEKKMGGSVTGRTYRDYFMTGHSAFGFAFLIFIFLFNQTLISGNDYWLSFWTNSEARRMDYLERNVTACDIDSQYDKHSCQDTYLGENLYLYVYSGFIIAVTTFCFACGLGFYSYCIRTSVSLHDKMFRSMVRAPIRFFDDNPSGRIMNRFTKDVGTMDEFLPPAFIDAINIYLQAIGVVVVVIVSNYYMSVPTVFLFVALSLIRKVFIETARDIKRIESVAKSPVFTHVAATIQGLTTIRACQSQDVLIKQFEGHQDVHSSAWYFFLAANRCFGIWLELLCDIFLVFVSFSFLLISSSDAGGNVGLAISSILTVMGEFQWGVRQSAETENYMTSVERALEYSNLTPEAELESEESKKPPDNWPELGQIEFKNLYLSYDQDKPVLKDLSFEIRPSEKIGIVGRTGAGKSSIIAALFRLTEPEGEIFIDSVNVKEIGLHDLRRNISIIPQDPVLFSGSVRYNLDPFDQFNDQDLWRVIEEVELKDQVSSLDYQVADGGANFSVGQRQLVCLGRALLRKNKILLMDEITANVDLRTDQFIQQTIRTKFADCTIITIAHRLHSIIDCDRILVLDHGHLEEYDHPHYLLQNEKGIFSGMVKQIGQSTSAMLKKVAEASLKNA